MSKIQDAEHDKVHDIFYDLVYNTSETLVLKKGKGLGWKTKNGLEMLEIQANESWKIWDN